LDNKSTGFYCHAPNAATNDRLTLPMGHHWWATAASQNQMRNLRFPGSFLVRLALSDHPFEQIDGPCRLSYACIEAVVKEGNMKGRILLLTAAAVVITTLLLSGVLSASAQSGNLWQIQYYANPYLVGQPAYTTTTYYVAYNWGTAAPAPNMPSVYWSARFTTSAYFNGGIYRFTVTADDGFTLRVNNVIIFSNIEAAAPGSTFAFDVPVNAGSNSVQVDYRQVSGGSLLYVNWFQGSGTPVYPGVSTLTPQPPKPTPIGPLKTAFGDYTRCVRRNLHQANCFQTNGAWNAPDIGSIQLEPKIVIWYLCNPGSEVQQPLTYLGALYTTQCSKTGAGYFVKPGTS
jgi:hypothetical protein